VAKERLSQLQKYMLVKAYTNGKNSLGEYILSNYEIFNILFNPQLREIEYSPKLGKKEKEIAKSELLANIPKKSQVIVARSKRKLEEEGYIKRHKKYYREPVTIRRTFTHKGIKNTKFVNECLVTRSASFVLLSKGIEKAKELDEKDKSLSIKFLIKIYKKYENKS